MQGLPRRYLLASVVYAGAVLLLLCLAVFAGSFSRTVVGETRVSGRFSPLPLFNRDALEELTVSWNGMSLRFSRASSPGLVRLETGHGTADIVLADSERLRLSSAGTDMMISQVPGNSAPAGVLDIPFKVTGVLQGDSGTNMLSWRQGTGAFQLVLPSGAAIDYDSRTISLRLGAASPSQMRLVSLSPAASPAAVSAAPAPTPRLPDEKSLPTQDQLAASMARFSDLAYSGWSVSRFSADDGSWKMADGGPGFAEEIGAGLLAESLERGSFSTAVQTWSNALDDQIGRSSGLQLTNFTCVYSGRVRDFAKRLRDRDTGGADRLKSLAAQGDASLAAQAGVLLYGLDRGGPALAKTILSSLQALDPARLPPASLLTVLEAMLDSLQFIGDDASIPQAARNLIENRLLPSIGADGSGAVFFLSQDGRVDLKQSIRCGSLLVRAGSLLQSSMVGALGRGLIVSSLSLASSDGFLPATLSLASGRPAAIEGAIAPESVYMMLPQGRHIPHEVPLYRLMGSGCWVWTAADVRSADMVDGEVRLTLSYPVGVPEHLVFQGVRPFQQIRLHGVPWHSDPSYAKYSDGWTYDEASRTLFMKITGRHDTEEVDLRF